MVKIFTYLNLFSDLEKPRVKDFAFVPITVVEAVSQTNLRYFTFTHISRVIIYLTCS